jgi:hypothetical protein
MTTIQLKVVEKEGAKNSISAVNLTKMNLSEEVAKKILNGDFAFIYLVSFS